MDEAVEIAARALADQIDAKVAEYHRGDARAVIDALEAAGYHVMRTGEGRGVLYYIPT